MNLMSTSIVTQYGFANLCKMGSSVFRNHVRLHFLFSLFFFITFSVSGFGNEISDENKKTGNPSTEWDITGAGDLTIQGFSTKMSVNKGETIYFKIKTDSKIYDISIYRIGYYKGLGARKWGNGIISANLPQVQPADLYDPLTGKTDCGNWDVSGYWKVPSNAVSGVYIAKLTRKDGSLGSSHITFIVRDDNGNSDILFKTSDATWQAYNNYGGTSLYGNIFGNDPPFIPVPGFAHATKVSYNRPLFSSKFGRDCFKSAEYPMVRWLERNGYDVSYISSVDMSSDVTPITPSKHKAIFTVGHDEYWSAADRKKFENARNAGVNLAFFSGNTAFWKTRWEDNYRTLVCYKEGDEPDPLLLVCGGKCDPATEWTGLWRSGCNFPLAGACSPENALVGQIGSEENNRPIEVSDYFKNLRFWRNTSVSTLSSGQKATLSNNTLGFEFEFDQYDNAIFGGGKPNFASSYPVGRVVLSNTNVNGLKHKMSLYKFSSGALVFGAGTIQYSWGLDDQHDRGSSVQDPRLQQATVNLLADMGIQPSSLQINLVKASQTNDKTPPKSVIAPIDPNKVSAGKVFQVTGTATDNGGGVVAGVEVSVDGGITWKPAEGTTNWTFAVLQQNEGDTLKIKSRSFDDIGNVEEEGNIFGPNYRSEIVQPRTCPCNVFIDTDVPQSKQNDNFPVAFGMRFRSTMDGKISKVRYYKASGSTGTRIGSLWTNEGTLISEVTFSNESEFGWQSAAFPSPIEITAGTTYVVSTFSPSGDYVFTRPYFTRNVVNSPLIGLKDGLDGLNGLGEYSTTGSIFPTGSYLSSNYWVDVEFINNGPLISKQPQSVTVCDKSTARFTSTAGSNSAKNIQWQKSADGVNWTDIAGETKHILEINAVSADNGHQVRAVWTNVNGTTISLPATLTVSPPIVATTSATPSTNSTVNDGTATVAVTGGTAPYSYLWSNNAPTPFINGLLMGTYSVKITDAAGCTATAQVSVGTLCTTPAVTINVNSSGDFCSGTEIIATTASAGSYTYEWKYSSAVVGNTQVFTFSGASPEGKYSVTASSGPGCTSSPVSYTYNKQNSLQSYTILGLDDVDLSGYNKVINGSVGNTRNGGEISFDDNGSIVAPDAFVKASKISIKSPSNISTRINSPVTVSLPTFLKNNSSTSGLPNVSISEGSYAIISGNKKDVSIGRNSTVFVTGSIYGKFQIGKGAKVYFSSEVIHFAELRVEDNSKIFFTNDAVVKLSGIFDVGMGAEINVNEKNVAFYVDSNVTIGEEVNFVGSIYAPNDNITVKGPSTFMTGKFIGKKVISLNNGVVWNSFDCGSTVAQRSTVPTTESAVESQQSVIEQSNKVYNGKLAVTISPNPVINQFKLNVQSSDNASPVTLRIVDLNGRTLMVKKTVANTQTIIDANAWTNGIYLAEISQAGNRKVLKVVKSTR